MSSLEFRLLGPVTVVRDGQSLSLGPPKRRAMVAALVLDPNRPVSLERLTDALWPGTPPASSVANLRTHASILRRRLGDRLTSRPCAYQLRIDDGELDVDEFARLAGAGRRALAAGDTGAALSLLATALGQWRGCAGDGLLRGTSLDAWLAALDEQHLDAVEDYQQARLSSVVDADLVRDLRRHVAQYPLRERGWGQLMLGLYRAGSAAAALDAYAHARAALREQLGIEPGPDLTRLWRGILDRDPTLHIGHTVVAAGPEPDSITLRTAPRQLPRDVGPLIGRERERAALASMVQAARAGGGPSVVAISGRAGVGKSALAVHIAHEVAADFPDGQVFVDARGLPADARPRAPGDLIAQVLRALGVPAADIPATLEERAATYRSMVADKRVLVLLDDVGSSAQVRPLVPSGRGGLLLITTPRPLTAVDGVSGVDLGPLSPKDATQVLGRYAGPRAATADPAGAARLVALCAGLPLALRIMGARLASRPDWPLSLFVAHLAERPLDTLEFEDLSVRRRLAADYRGVAAADELAARTFQSLGRIQPHDVTPQQVASHLDEPAGMVFQALECLVDAGLAASPQPGRYRVPDLLHNYAAELAADAASPERAEPADVRGHRPDKTRRGQSACGFAGNPTHAECAP